LERLPSAKHQRVAEGLSSRARIVALLQGVYDGPNNPLRQFVLRAFQVAYDSLRFFLRIIGGKRPVDVIKPRDVLKGVDDRVNGMLSELRYRANRGAV
jgi:hypothetical protein